MPFFIIHQQTYQNSNTIKLIPKWQTSDKFFFRYNHRRNYIDIANYHKLLRRKKITLFIKNFPLDSINIKRDNAQPESRKWVERENINTRENDNNKNPIKPGTNIIMMMTAFLS